MAFALLAWALSTCLVSASAPALPAGEACAAGQRLDIGASCWLRVDAGKAEVALPIRLAVGDSYRITVLGDGRWGDWGRPQVDPASGDKGNLVMKLFGWLKRLPREPYMVIGMATSTGDERGTDLGHETSTSTRLNLPTQTVEVRTPMRLAFFANDVRGLNWNNHGEIRLTVERLGAPPERPNSP